MFSSSYNKPLFIFLEILKLISTQVLSSLYRLNRLLLNIYRYVLYSEHLNSSFYIYYCLYPLHLSLFSSFHHSYNMCVYLTHLLLGMLLSVVFVQSALQFLDYNLMMVFVYCYIIVMFFWCCIL